MVITSDELKAASALVDEERKALNSCPFCRGKAELYIVVHHNAKEYPWLMKGHIECLGCGAQSTTVAIDQIPVVDNVMEVLEPLRDSMKETLIKRWNQRSEAGAYLAKSIKHIVDAYDLPTEVEQELVKVVDIFWEDQK